MPAIRHHADQAHPEHRQRHAGDRRRRGTPARATGRRWPSERIRHDLDRAHRGEVVRHDRERQQQRRGQRHSPALVADRDRQRGVAEQHAEQDGSDDEVDRPDHAAGHFERRHAEIVHAGDAGPDHRAADRRAPAATGLAGGEAEAARGQYHGHGERARAVSAMPYPVGTPGS